MLPAAPTARRPRWNGGLLAAVLAVVAALLLALPALAAPTFPKATGRVTDAAGVLPADTRAAIEARLATLESTTGIELAVATVPDLQGEVVEDYANGLYRAWGIGKRGTNNGALLLVAPADRKVRIEVGYGLEGVITDALSSQIIRREILPRFKAGDLPGGIAAGSAALIGHLELPPEQRAQAVAAVGEGQRGEGRSEGNWFGTLVWIAIILIWIFLSVARGGRGRRRGPVILWGPGIGGGWGGGGGGGFGGGGFGGGGFGGFGGGSSGGGGASGSW